MNPTLVRALDTLACTAVLMLPMMATNAPADAQSLEDAGQAVQHQTIDVAGYDIPKFQAMPPAGFEGVLPFRPACDQLTAQASETPGMNDWVFVMNDGRRHVMEQMPDFWSPVEAHKELNAYGLCKTDGAEVPNIYAWEVPEQPTVTPATLPEGDISQIGTATEASGHNWWLVIGAGVALTMVGCGVVAYRQRTKSVSHADSNGFVAHRREPERAQVDDRLNNLFED